MSLRRALEKQTEDSLMVQDVGRDAPSCWNSFCSMEIVESLFTFLDNFLGGS